MTTSRRDYDAHKPLWIKANSRLRGIAATCIPGDAEAIDDSLHMAITERFGLTSLKDCSARQLHQLANSLEKLKPLTSKKVRQRSGRPARANVTRMITPKQRSLIRKLASELGWSRSLLMNFLKTHFSVDSIDRLATSKKAGEAINMLIGFKRKKQKTNRNKCAAG